MHDYVAIVGFDDEYGVCQRIIDIHACQNFIQAVEIATLCIIDAGSYERILKVEEVDRVQSALIDTTPPVREPTF